MKKLILFIILVFIIIFVSACTNQQKESSQSSSQKMELNAVSDDISLRSGTGFDGEIVLESTDFTGFDYKYNESLQEYVFTFRLTAEGQEKMKEATTKIVETSGELSLWIGDELISTPRVMEPITGDGFSVNIVDLKEDGLSDLVDKLKGKFTIIDDKTSV